MATQKRPTGKEGFGQPVICPKCDKPTHPDGPAPAATPTPPTTTTNVVVDLLDSESDVEDKAPSPFSELATPAASAAAELLNSKCGVVPSEEAGTSASVKEGAETNADGCG
ncbi:hypothetical protein PHYSODRAFT_338166 [Phytophthora sojae]|uniref:Uncharacterized protein n=1 Tax=Phytophthora sojae (strain P6497) TaxID=1094619 RepID=G5A3C5_PHYSP|nr:hypothetical protein PHYSODRAFT_338166 [Phytophthora sojae]EGZ09350.1 hypothetical protein PHYSODRAFT_338166 [Phytophthora sojae]|eukprot:XP_009534211.1 hypothetical protein PHYSODRAFT_338166 [Phytophthora sojae]